MKKYLFGLLAAGAALAAGCSEDNLPEASFSLFQVESVTATAGDGEATVRWTPQEGKPAPAEYYVSWVADDSEVAGGSQTVASDTYSLTVTDLVNDCAYTFSVQSRYADGLAMKISAVCTPKSTRMPASELKAMAGDERVYLSWTAPDTQLDYAYRIVVTAGGSEVKRVEVESSETSALIEELANGTEYAFALTCVYAHGDSEAVTATATPGEIDPINVTSTTLRQFELCTFEYNPAYFVQGEIASVKWEFGDGNSSDETVATYCYAKTGSYTVTLTVTYEGGTTETATVELTVDGFAWISVGGTGYQKSSNIVFSHDGQTFYTISQTDKKLLAISAITGQIVWEYATSAATYGAGPAVGADGTVYFGTEDGDGTLYAVSASGALKWKATLGAAVKASPAVTTDGVVYALADGGILKAFDAVSGAEKWSATQTGNAGGVAVDADGTVYIGTSKGIWAYTEGGTLKWTCDTEHNVTERGGSLAIGGGVLYATLKSKGGCAAVDTATGRTLWTYALQAGDSYHPVVDGDGTVYFCEKNGYLYAVDKNGSEKWVDQTDKNYIYSGFALAADGKAYISQYASPFNLLAFDASGNRSIITSIGAQTMSPVSIGPDGRVYYGLNGSISAYDIAASLAAEGWPMRGGNMQGSNSLK
ncbi:MAG: PQQ-binding-like beta-propeller repeat protein [Alistipes onderdonkii]|nr:PQQ-binding-like beta-propeller repeat protein [Alistipes onderdonkii]MEE0850207.1 PQQ-binding-like beta-propeller repeat protein [Alistipes onderdonkii]